MKKFLTLIILFFIIWKAYWENNLDEEVMNIDTCYDSIYKIEKKDIENIENLKIEVDNSDELKIVQWDFELNKKISSELEKNIQYKNNFWIYLNDSNDNNLETFIIFDTLEWKEIIIELDEITIKNNFEFNLEYESNHYLIEIEISIDWENYEKIEKENIINKEFKFIKLTATCEKFSCIREKIKIFELNIIKKYYELYFNNINSEEIKIYKNYSCEKKQIELLNENSTKFDLEKKNIEINNELELKIEYIKVSKIKIEKNNVQYIDLTEKILEQIEEDNLESYNLEIEILEEEIEKIKKINQFYSDEIEIKNRKNNIYMNILIFLLIVWTWYGIYYYSNKNN